MPVLTIVTFALDLLSLAAALGLIFALVIQPRREPETRYFLLLCGSVALTALASLILNRALIAPTDVAPVTALHTRAAAMALIAAAFYAFVVDSLKPRTRFVRIANVIVPLLLVLVLAVIAFTGIFDADLSLTAAGYGVLAAGVAALAFTFWIIWSSGQPVSRGLRLPAILLIAAYAINAVPALRPVPLDTLLITAALLVVGWTALRQQISEPIQDLSAELRVANRDLHQALNEMSRGKERIEELTEELRASGQYKSEFLANMSHELRTPLNSIIGYSELLQNGLYGPLTDKQSDRIEKIHRNGKALLDVISDILDLNKIDSGRLRLDPEFFALAPVVTMVTESVRAEATAKGLALAVHVPDMPDLYGDPLRIRQVLQNVVDNAVKFTLQGGIDVSVERFSVVKGVSKGFPLPMIGWLRDGEWVVLSIKDTGIGIAPEDQARIFEEFAQVDGSRTREFGGTGLGLAIAKKLVIMHEGQIWVRSRPDEGSTFFIALPADVKAPETAAASTP
ncbi:MAG TPA: HAMP domain-containing sensor histidine kinase [Aggregatilineales bacterium]|nr:HAMP domain-containing sensor histidine kinase [Aggregatilineales bacterium]